MSNYDQLLNDCWDIDLAIAEFTFIRLLFYKNMLQGCEFYPDGFEDAEDWETIIDEMLQGFGIYIKGGTHKCKECTDDQGKLLYNVCPKVDRAWNLLNEYRYYLWL